jgi:NAD(P)-dependent dehydrogenase (short-subunit alcohol dehydrogenase family)
LLHPEITSDDIRAMHSVDGRVIIVTGSAQGVGRGMAHHLGKSGATIVVADCRRWRLVLQGDAWLIDDLPFSRPRCAATVRPTA